MRRSERCDFLVEHLDMAAATGVDNARWEYFQLRHLSYDGTFSVENKSRQIAWSWLVAAEGIANAVLYGQSSAYVSINLDEAREKIRYAKAIYEALEGVALPGIVRDNDLGLELGNGARLLSLPGRPPRGKARMNIYLDEFAHVQHDREIYTAALPIISKGGCLRMGSSPFGASGVFWEVFSEAMRQYPGYRRQATPWWEVQAFCVNVVEARKLAPAMPTAHRVELFGNDRIKAIWANMPEDDFRQEYECEFVDESTAWITWDEIRAIQDDGLRCLCVSGVDAAFPAIDAMREGVPRGEYELSFVAGLDIGRTRNTTELAIVGLTRDNRYPLRAMLTLDNVEFDSQQAVVAYALRNLPISALWIDENGIGRNLAENLARMFGGNAQGVDFTNASKAMWATDTKMLVQQHKTPIPVDRELAYQIHSIKRKITPSKNMVFDTETNEKHHADKFWAWALALSAGYARVKGAGSYSIYSY